MKIKFTLKLNNLSTGSGSFLKSYQLLEDTSVSEEIVRNSSMKNGTAS